MSHSGHILEDLFRHADWASGRLLRLCTGLTDAQLDEQREMGFGSLRNTLFHILAAEEIWLERWQGRPWRPFEADARGCPLDQIAARLQRVAAERASLMQAERADDWQRRCEYKDGKGNVHHNVLRDLLWHVANHGIHHRAQALNYLRHFDRKVPGGLDYIFFRLAHPTVGQDPAVAEGFRGYGLEINTSPGHELAWDRDFVRRYFQYSDWATSTLLDSTAALPESELDRGRAMGMDSLRKTITHMLDAEQWWLRNWTTGPSAFEKLPESTSLAEVRGLWTQVIAQRNQFIENLDAAHAARVVTALVGAAPVHVAVVESLVQLCGHGTHHRAQWINMLRQAQAPLVQVDVIFWLRR